MLSEGVDNQLISVDTWAAFAEKGGLKGVVDFMPLDSVLQALRECYAAREQAKQVVYEITGISDIIRGSTIASETAAAQQIKSQYASLRIKPRQTEVAQFASEVLRIKAQIMCDFYAPQTLVEMSGIMGTMDAQYAEQAIMLLKSEPARGFRIEVASDSLVEMDEATEKQSRIEFLGAVGQFMDRALPVTQQVPELAPLMGEMLMFGVRAFKGGRMMESAFDEAMAKLNAPKPPEQPQPDPEQMKAEAMMQVEQGKMQLEQAKIQTQGQIEQFKAQQAKELEQMRQEYESAREQVRQEAETQRLQMKAQIEAETKLQIAEMQRSLSEKPAVSVEIAGEEKLSEVGEQVKQMADIQQSAVLQAVEMLAEAVEKMNKPRRKLLQRGEDGRAIGVIEIEED
jgi:hypothetical protein